MRYHRSFSLVLVHSISRRRVDSVVLIKLLVLSALFTPFLCAHCQYSDQSVFQDLLLYSVSCLSHCDPIRILHLDWLLTWVFGNYHTAAARRESLARFSDIYEPAMTMFSGIYQRIQTRTSDAEKKIQKFQLT